MLQIFYLLTILTLIGCDTNKGSGDFAVFEGNNENFQISKSGSSDMMTSIKYF